MDDATVKEIAKRCGKSVQQILLRWALQRRPSGSVIFKSTSPEHIKARGPRV